MPDKRRCVGCDRVGFVRREHVIEKGNAQIHYYCGHCEHTWTTQDVDQKGQPPGGGKPDRSRY